MERLAVAHDNLVKADKKVEQCRYKFPNAKTESEKSKITEQYKELKITLDGVYTELKRAQDTATKSIRHKKQLLNERLKTPKE